MMRSPPTTSSSAQYSNHSTIVTMHWFVNHICSKAFAQQANGCFEQVKGADVLWWLTILVTQVWAEFHVICFFRSLSH